MFRLFKRNSKTVIYAPISGTLFALEEVPDPVFSQRMMGEGVAIQPNEGRVVAPLDGEVVTVAPTKHAIGMRSTDGTEVLVHVGLETVSLQGEGFEVQVKSGERVTRGQSLLVFDLDLVGSRAQSMLSPVVITNQAESQKQVEVGAEKEITAGETVILTVTAER